ncbi:mandelate racemase/muconate lactonizing enzyme family protein [Paraburkholderia sp. BCC1885]|uniref:mandelate racemase/muconate lactonizing enzyme family protein n=1 Tax=Paraburkholderia sp. BCC1885 TaxID=2562669 RepID=UPI001183D7E5|nr:mandelate racemase/muconate lactonizing enzyme family protein [Paraburkholderia sp. BCC1885]
MQIQSIDVFGYALSYAHGEYVMSNGRAAVSQLSTLVRVRTSDGLEGWGEASTLGGTYLPAFGEGVRAAIKEMAPHLIGLDATNVSLVSRVMDSVLLGQKSAKSAIDIACWDIFGRACNRPISALLGGVLQESFPLYEAVPLASPAEMVEFVRRRSADGIRRFQVKVGNDPYDDIRRTRSVVENAGDDAVIIADSNGGWNLQAAIIAVRGLAGLNVYVEQPCRDIADCAIVQRSSTLPLVLDEPVVNMAELYRAKYEAGAGSINLKLGRLGGISAAVRIREAAAELGMTMCIEDVWGGDVATAAIAHVAASATPESFLHASFFNDWTREHVAGYLPRSVNGRGSAPTGPGLGIDVDAESLGKPLFSIS